MYSQILSVLSVDWPLI